jgi:hypothetical protein
MNSLYRVHKKLNAMEAKVSGDLGLAYLGLASLALCFSPTKEDFLAT